MVRREVVDRYPPENATPWVPSPKRVRVFFGGEALADSRRVMLLRPYPLVYYFPEEDVRMDRLTPTDHTEADQRLGPKSYFDVKVGDRKAENAAWMHRSPPSGAPDLEGYIAFDWDAMDAWFEEDEPVRVHPRDPYVRIDVLQGSRAVKVVINGVTVAETSRPLLLFETGLQTRYYLFQQDIRMDLLTLTAKETHCPYKGTASYYSVHTGDKVVENVAWSYHFPNPEYPAIQDLIAFYNEHIDEFYVDGQIWPEPGA